MQVPTSQLLSEYLLNTRDSTDANKTVGKQRMDHHYTFLLSQTNNHVAERKKYGNLKGDQRSYLLPPSYIPNGLKMVRVFINNRWTELEPVLPASHWAEFTKDLTFDDLPTHFTVMNEQGRPYIEVDGVPINSSTENLELTYLGYQDPLIFPDDYTTGTVTLKYDYPYIHGQGTTFTADMVGRSIKVAGGKNWYEIDSWGTALEMTMVHNYQENVTTEAVSYVIAEVPKLPHEFHYTPMYAAVADYYRPKNSSKSKEYQDLYDRDLLLIQRRYQNKTQGSVKPGIPVNRSTPRVPYNYPNSTITRL